MFLKNNCLHPSAEVCSGQQWITCSSDEVIFHCDYDCEDATSNPCMIIEGFATKYCSGPVLLCPDFFSNYHNKYACPERGEHLVFSALLRIGF
jgi:hypothetical protein